MRDLARIAGLMRRFHSSVVATPRAAVFAVTVEFFEDTAQHEVGIDSLDSNPIHFVAMADCALQIAYKHMKADPYMDPNLTDRVMAAFTALRFTSGTAQMVGEKRSDSGEPNCGAA